MGIVSDEWYLKGVCRNEWSPTDPDLFFPSSGNSHAYTIEAKAMCARCPVRNECLIAGWNEQGTWGGFSREERLAAQELGYTAQNMIEIRNAKEQADAEAE